MSSLPFDDSEDTITPEQAARFYDDCRRRVNEFNEFSFISTEQRNILFVGKNRSGKSTAVEVLRDPCYCPEQASIFSDPAAARVRSFALQDNTSRGEHARYTLSIVDTAGLFEVRQVGEISRDNKEITKIIVDCLERDLTYLHAVVLFISFESGVDRDSISSIKKFANIFGRDINMALCITRADKHNMKWTKAILDEISQHEDLHTLIRDHNMEILFMGCADRTGTGITEEGLLNQFKAVYQMRRKFCEFLFSSEHAVRFIEMPLTQMKITETQELMEFLETLIDQLLISTPDDPSLIQKFRESQKKVLKKLASCRFFLVYEGVFDHIRRIRQKLLQLHTQMPFSQDEEQWVSECFELLLSDHPTN